MRAGSLLQRHQVFRSRDAEETRAFLGRKDYNFDPSRRARQLDVRINAVYMPRSYVAYVEYGPVAVDLTPGVMRKDHLIQIPVRGHVQTRLGNDSLIAGPLQAVIASPAHDKCRFISGEDSARVQLVLADDVLVEQLAALLDEPPKEGLDFIPAIDLTRGYGRSLSNFVLSTIADLEQADSILLHPMMMHRFEQFIATGLLLSQPNNYMQALHRQQRPVATRNVQRAIDYMESNLDQAVTLRAIVEASGVAGRTLLQHFKDTRGISPMRYLRDARFEKAREALSRAQTGESVTAICLGFGFSHLGRFSVEYRKRFGESPSETLRSARSYPGRWPRKH